VRRLKRRAGFVGASSGSARLRVVICAVVIAGVVGQSASPHVVAAADGVIAAPGDPVIAAAGDIACDPSSGAYNGGDGTPTDCRGKYTAGLLSGADGVLALGDNQYQCGGLTAFNQAYDPTWGTYKAITHPVAGNHEYQTSPGTGCATNASGYFTYFGANAGDPSKGYYSFNQGAWHIIALNSECSWIGGCGAGSPEDLWLKNDLATNSAAPCTLAYWHRPRFGSTTSGGDSTYSQFWQDLYAAKADVVLNGHEHWYERFALQNPSKQPDPNGIREFIVGTGGESYLQPSSTHAANSELLFWGQYAYGVLKMTLHAGSYDWGFVPVTGGFTDAGSTECHNAAATGTDTSPPTTSMSCNGGLCSTGWYQSLPVTVALSATDTGGSGVASTYYTTDGSDPASSPTRTAYSGPFTVSETTAVRFLSTDNTGNTEAAKSQTIRIDAAPPTVGITAPTDGSFIKRGTKVAVTATATDNGSGAGAPSGIARVDFYVDGNKVATATALPYGFTWNTRPGAPARHTLTAVAVDAAGNSASSATVTVRITK
jgi:hypothetical protein